MPARTPFVRDLSAGARAGTSAGADRCDRGRNVNVAHPSARCSGDSVVTYRPFGSAEQVGGFEADAVGDRLELFEVEAEHLGGVDGEDLAELILGGVGGAGGGLE